MIIVYRLIKFFYIIVFKKKYKIEQMKTIIFNKLIEYSKILKEIISNRNTLFKSN